MTVSLTGLTKDLDLAVLAAGAGGGCDPSFPGCMGAKSTTDNEVVSFTAQGAQPYYIVVDGYGSEAGTFTLTVNCP